MQSRRERERQKIVEEERRRAEERQRQIIAEKGKERQRVDKEKRKRQTAAQQNLIAEDELSQQVKTSLALLQPKVNKDVCPPMVCKISKSRKRVMWIMCDDCEQWYHVECVGLTTKVARSIETWICDLCD